MNCSYQYICNKYSKSISILVAFMIKIRPIAVIVATVIVTGRWYVPLTSNHRGSNKNVI